ncbi:exopolysaccharide biosynthesis polyprenyl glycosylphosphotransferase [bacterium]|nr:exopolysaccharide biosynthesis polyprenyl glycosylphosphotransferase [bacterium]
MNIVFVIILLLIDAIGTIAAWQMTFLLRVRSGLFETPLPIETLLPIIFLTVFWWILFALRGMYRTPLAISRFDVLVRCFSSFAIGILLIFILTFDINDPINFNRLFLIHYGLIAFILVSIGRLTLRVLQRRIRWRRKGLYRALIIGFNDVGKKLNDQLYHYPVWGFQVSGFIDDEINEGEHLGVKILGGRKDISEIVNSEKIQFLLIAQEKQSQAGFLDIFDYCNSPKMRFMIVADYDQMVSGLVKTVEIHGLPLVEVMPISVSLRSRIIKRLIDILVSIIVGSLLLILTPLLGLLIKINNRGSVFNLQKRIGRFGKEFTMVEFRSESGSGESGATSDRSIKHEMHETGFNRFLQNSHLDELPQIFNVLIGQMSLVGPRPEKQEIVEKFQDKVPLYRRRMRVRPGITGWAQVRHKYDTTLEDIKEETKYDLFYIDHISLALDIKIILTTFLMLVKGDRK